MILRSYINAKRTNDQKIQNNFRLQHAGDFYFIIMYIIVPIHINDDIIYVLRVFRMGLVSFQMIFSIILHSEVKKKENEEVE